MIRLLSIRFDNVWLNLTNVVRLSRNGALLLQPNHGIELTCARGPTSKGSGASGLDHIL